MVGDWVGDLVGLLVGASVQCASFASATPSASVRCSTVGQGGMSHSGVCFSAQRTSWARVHSDWGVDVAFSCAAWIFVCRWWVSQRHPLFNRCASVSCSSCSSSLAFTSSLACLAASVAFLTASLASLHLQLVEIYRRQVDTRSTDSGLVRFCRVQGLLGSLSLGLGRFCRVFSLDYFFLTLGGAEVSVRDLIYDALLVDDGSFDVCDGIISKLFTVGLGTSRAAYSLDEIGGRQIGEGLPVPERLWDHGIGLRRQSGAGVRAGEHDQ